MEKARLLPGLIPPWANGSTKKRLSVFYKQNECKGTEATVRRFVKGPT